MPDRSNGQQGLNAQPAVSHGDMARTMAPLFGQVVALLAMKYGRAPLPVSPSLVRWMARNSFSPDVDEMTNFARRYLFLGDERMLLAELKRHSASMPVTRSVFTEHTKEL